LFDVPEQPENEEYEPRLNVVPGGRVYIENNLDRFGLPIRPMKPLNIVPGPGEYEVLLNRHLLKNGLQKMSTTQKNFHNSKQNLVTFRICQ